jgi:hypothetical protein
MNGQHDLPTIDALPGTPVGFGGRDSVTCAGCGRQLGAGDAALLHERPLHREDRYVALTRCVGCGPAWDRADGVGERVSRVTLRYRVGTKAVVVEDARLAKGVVQ